MKGIISFLSPNRRECFRINEKKNICRKYPDFSGKKKSRKSRKIRKEKIISFIFVVNCVIVLNNILPNPTVQCHLTLFIE